MKLVSSAIKFQLENSDYWHIMTGLRHANVYATMYELNIKYKKSTVEEGFLTDTNQFFNRFDAVEVAYKANQINNNKIFELFSEDLW